MQVPMSHLCELTEDFVVVGVGGGVRIEDASSFSGIRPFSRALGLTQYELPILLQSKFNRNLGLE
jgi:hypothetical protein